jgi:hypothetical protein
MAFSAQFTIQKKEWLEHPEQRWNKGLERAGMSFHNTLRFSNYPPIPPASTYKRTTATAKKANFRITQVGREMEFGSTSYLPYLLIPAKTVQHWGNKRYNIVNNMRNAFRKGIAKFDATLEGDS